MSRKERRKAAAIARNNDLACPGPNPSPTAAPEPAPAPQPPDERQEIRRTYLQKFQPADGVELDLVEEMISAQWCQRCLAVHEEAAFVQLRSVPFDALSKSLAGIQRLRANYAIQFNRALAGLLKLRSVGRKTEKPAPPPLEVPEEVLSPETTEPPPGFPTLADPLPVFPPQEIQTRPFQ